MRPGRIDLMLKLNFLTNNTFKKMINRYYPDFNPPTGLNVKEKTSPAYFQALVMANRNNPEAVVNKLKTP